MIWKIIIGVLLLCMIAVVIYVLNEDGRWYK